MELGSLPVWAQQLGGLILTIATAIALTWNERRKGRGESIAGEGASQVVAATFTERGQMERLTSALISVERAVTASTTNTSELLNLLKAEAQRRHDESVVRQALRDRGIIDP